MPAAASPAVARVGVTTPMGRAGKPDEIAEAILWLLDDRSSYVAGALLDVSAALIQRVIEASVTAM